MKKGFLGKRIVSTLCAAALVTGGLPAVALATTERPSTDKTRMPTTAMNTNGYVKGVCLDAPRAMATMEILGISSINDAQGNNDLAGYGTGYTTVPGTAWDKAYYAYDHDWNHTQYWLFASDYNESPNPFWVNRGIGAKVSDTQKGVVAGKLMGSLAAYGADDTSTAVWNMMPNVFMASTAQSLANLPSITPTSSVDEKFAGYSPLSAANTLNNFTSYIAGMKAVATAADKAAAGSDGIAGNNDDLTLRYGSATDIANKMQKWLLGTQGYILENIMSGTVKKKTIAVLGSASSQGGGGGNKGGEKSMSLEAQGKTTTWTLSSTYNEAYEGIVSKDASYTDVVLPDSIAYNLATTLGKTTVTTDELAQADLIVCTSTTDLENLIANNLGDKAYYGGTNSGVIHSAANAELFQQMPRVLPCLYPTLLDQSDYMAYMYDEFYHLNGGDLLSEACVNLFGCGNGVLNWAATDSDGDGTISATEKMTWSTNNFSGYSAQSVVDKYTEGWNYLQSVKAVSGDKTASFEVGDSSTIDDLLNNANVTDPDSKSGSANFTYTSSNPSVVSIDTNGKIKCGTAGTSYIIVKSKSYSDAVPLTITVTVTAPTTTLSTTAQDVRVGDEFTVDVKMTGTLAEAQGKVSYDSAKLELVSATSTLENFEGTNGKISFKGNTTKFKDTVVASLTFKAIGEADATSIKVSDLTYAKPSDSANYTMTDSNAISLPIGEQVITYKLGDVNNNTIINIVDAQIVLDMSNKVYGETYATLLEQLKAAGTEWSYSTEFAAADVNTDNAVNANDARAIQVYVHTGAFDTKTA